MTLEKLEILINLKTGVDLKDSSRKTSLTQARAIFSYLATKYTLFNNQDIAKYLGCSEGSIRNNIKQHWDKSQHDFEYRYNLKEVETFLKNNI